MKKREKSLKKIVRKTKIGALTVGVFGGFILIVAIFLIKLVFLFGFGGNSASAKSSASAQNFTFSNFSADYELSRNSENRSVLKVRENLTAIFPETDQNHGIERAIPVAWNGHPVFDGNLTVSRNGNPEEINGSEKQGNYEVFQIGNSDTYVHGTQKYTLEYELTDVTNGDILLWQANGGAWKVPFLSADATLTTDFSGGNFAKSSANSFASLTKNSENSTNSADEIFAKNWFCAAGNSDEISASAKDFFANDSSCRAQNISQSSATFSSTKILHSGESLVFGAEFPAGTFANFSPSDEQIFTKNLFWILVGIFAILLIFLIVFAILRGRNSRTGKAIIPRYSPPENIDLPDFARIYSRNKRRILSAILLKLAVDGNIKIVAPDKEKNEKKFAIKLITKTGADEISRQYLNAFFSGGDKEFSFAKTNVMVGERLAQILQNDRENFLKSEYFRAEKGLKIAAIILLVFAISMFFFLSPYFSGANFAQWDEIRSASGFVNLLAILLGIFAIFVLILKPLSEKGAELRDYAFGLKMFIKIAESERIKFLQSAKTVELTEENVAKIYEKLLPYAEIFGLEKSWSKVLARKYAGGNSPSWFVGNGDFSVGVFAASVGSFSSGIGSYSASSSGGSGGGFGGAGGGGGGGGW